MNHVARATVGGLLLGAIVSLFFLLVDLMPFAASEESHEIDFLFKTYAVIGSVIFGLVVSFLLYSVVIFRRQNTEDRGASFSGHLTLQRTWLVLTTLLVLASAADAILVVGKVFAPRTGYAQSEMQVGVTAAQWSWVFDYPEYQVRSSQLVLELGRPVVLNIQSRDVVHSLFVPEFRMKMDAVPGMTNELRVVPTVPGQYQIECAALCGLAHTQMRAAALVLTHDEFQKWVTDQKKG